MESLQRSSVFAVHGASHQCRLKELLTVNPGTPGQRMVVYSSTNFRGAGACPSQAGFANSKIGGQVCCSDSQLWCVSVGVALADRLGWLFHEAGF